MMFFVGSTNPVKVNAAQVAAKNTWPDLQVQGYEVVSGVSAQPVSDQETRQGAQNRARLALQKGVAEFPDVTEYLGVGMEGGVFTDTDGQMWSTVWGCVLDASGVLYEANGGRIKVPHLIADQIKAGGEMGPAISQLLGVDNVKQKQGMFGVITNNFVTRTDEYASILQMSIGLWYGREWAAGLPSSL